MAYEQKDMSGSVFKNKKMDRDTSPNLTGSCKIDGKEYWVNAWTKTDKNGDKWLSLAFKEKQPRNDSSGRSEVYHDGTPARSAQKPPFDDEVPF